MNLAEKLSSRPKGALFAHDNTVLDLPDGRWDATLLFGDEGVPYIKLSRWEWHQGKRSYVAQYFETKLRDNLEEAQTERKTKGDDMPRPAFVPNTEVVEQIMEVISNAENGASRGEVLEQARISPQQWTQYINRLLRMGRVERRGERRSARYFLVQEEK